jgi:hypothetical protein
MGQPFGRWLVGLLGAVVIGIGVFMIVKAWRRKYENKLDLSRPLMQRLRPSAGSASPPAGRSSS